MLDEGSFGRWDWLGRVVWSGEGSVGGGGLVGESSLVGGGSLVEERGLVGRQGSLVWFLSSCGLALTSLFLRLGAVVWANMRLLGKIDLNDLYWSPVFVNYFNPYDRVAVVCAEHYWALLFVF